MFSKSHFQYLLLGAVFVSLFLLIPAISQAACADVPVGGSYTVSSSCTFANTVDGVDGGGITINAGATLTVNAGQTVVWSPGSSLVINGAIAIANGAQLKQTYLWVTDSDNDGYPSSTTMVAQDTAPTGGKRRSAITAFTYETDSSGANAMKLDYDDSSATVYPGTTCNGDCSENKPDGTCGPKAAGENGLPACQRCDGTSLTHVNLSTFADSEGTNTCAGTCAGYCSSGSCVSTDTSTGTCNTTDSTRVASGGTGHCSAGSCAADCIANGATCSAASDCCSGYCYTDGDGDGYAGSGNNTCRASASLGTDCNDSNASLYVNRSCYPDSDGDGHYAKTTSTVCSGSSCPSGYSSSTGDDCCDSDSNTYPGEANYYSTTNACGSWDWDCSSTIEKNDCSQQRKATPSGAYPNCSCIHEEPVAKSCGDYYCTSEDCNYVTCTSYCQSASYATCKCK